MNMDLKKNLIDLFDDEDVRKALRKVMITLMEDDDHIKNTIINNNKSVEADRNAKYEKENDSKEISDKLQKVKNDLEIVNKEWEKSKKDLEKSKKDLDTVSKERDDLKEKLSEKDRMIKEKENECKGFVKQCDEAVKEKDRAIQDYGLLKKKYNDIDEIYNMYCDLGDAIIKKMERILNQSSKLTGSPDMFMAFGMQENNITALWDSIAANHEYYDSLGKIDDLVKIFKYFFGLYKEITYKTVDVIVPKAGDTYDERKHTRTNDSNAVGIIKEVILPGFSIGKNISKKALVVVK